jgi:hypothetical protein
MPQTVISLDRRKHCWEICWKDGVKILFGNQVYQRLRAQRQPAGYR